MSADRSVRSVERARAFGPPRLCTAHSSRTGKPCRLHAINGSTVCGSHGGRAPQVIARAKQRILEAADPAAAALIRLALDATSPPASRVAALNSILDRAGLTEPTKQQWSGPDGAPLTIQVVMVDPAPAPGGGKT